MVIILVLGGWAVWAFRRLRHRHRVIDTRPIKSLGTFCEGRLGMYLVSSSSGRRFVSLEYEVERENMTLVIEVLFTGRQAAALANHLEVAAFPHASLAFARAGVRRAKAGRARLQPVTPDADPASTSSPPR